MKKVSVICIDCGSEYIDDRLGNQTYSNLEVVEAVTGSEFYQDITDYCESTDSDYITFLEPGQWLGPDKIKNMVEYAEKLTSADVFFCNRNYGEYDGTVVAYPDRKYRNVFKDMIFEGSRVLYRCLSDGRNLLGNLTTMMFRREQVLISIENLRQYAADDPAIQKALLLFEILSDQVMGLLEQTLVCTFVQEFNLQELKRQQDAFVRQLGVFAELYGWGPRNAPYGMASEHEDLLREKDAKIKRGLKGGAVRKDITFFATDKGEYYNLLPIMKEAEARGYQVRCTDDLGMKAEIGVYCQHQGMPQNSRFSVVLLHDMAQGHNRWPNIWEAEHWSDYDIGIVPGENWKNRWERCAFHYYAYPRYGCYMFGYPKSNEVYSAELERLVKERKETLGLKHEVSVLYAPSWENDGKEEDFVRALSSLPVNLIVKQASWPEVFAKEAKKKGFEDVVANIREMRELHEGKYDNLYYIEPEESIMVALKMCDLVVSDESSVMVEGMMFGKPALAVEDWLIPDTLPKRCASIPYEEAYKCKKAGLREAVEKLIGEASDKEEILRKSENIFVNKEYVNRDILDAIEYFALGTGNDGFLKWKMSSRYMPVCMWS